MPTTVSNLFQKVGLECNEPILWGERVPESKQGIYVVSLSCNPHFISETISPVDPTLVAQWLNKVPTLIMDGVRPTVNALTARLSGFWIPDETILYIGKAGKDKGSTTSVGKRVGAYYRTPLGKPRPHAGGHWIKTLRTLKELSIFWASTDKPETAENLMLEIFVNNISPQSRARLIDPTRPLPFANLEYPKGNQKGHGICGSVLRD